MNRSKQKLISFVLFGGILLLFYMFNPDARDMTSWSDNIKKILRIENCTPNASSTFQVLTVIDGDTIEVATPSCSIERVRMIGINTPETVDPRRPVQCFGKEASKKAREILDDKVVRLEGDPVQGERDKYGRLLAYVFLPEYNDQFFNLWMIEEGYAYEYTYQTVYKYQKEFKEAEFRARQMEKGLWNPKACDGEI